MGGGKESLRLRTEFHPNNRVRGIERKKPWRLGEACTGRLQAAESHLAVLPRCQSSQDSDTALYILAISSSKTKIFLVTY